MKIEHLIKQIKNAKLTPEQRNFAGKLMDWVLEDESRIESLCFYAVLADSFQWNRLPEKDYEE